MLLHKTERIWELTVMKNEDLESESEGETFAGKSFRGETTYF